MKPTNCRLYIVLKSISFLSRLVDRRPQSTSSDNKLRPKTQLAIKQFKNLSAKVQEINKSINKII
jgi:hypothetical protein